MQRYVESNLKPYRRRLEQILRLDYAGESSPAVGRRAADLRRIIDAAGARADHRLLLDILPEAFALVCAVVKQEFGWHVFDSQLLAALAMMEGRIVELDTGEGKTLAAVFVAFLQSLRGGGVHVLTFNDYLAGRDAEWMGPLYRRLGVNAAAIRQDMEPARRKLAYQADVTYLTAKEAGFDYLRGFLTVQPENLVQRPFTFAIVDEADSILIDEARIPLVLAGGEGGPGAIDPALYRLVSALQPGRHYQLDPQNEHVILTEQGAAWLERQLNIANLYDEVHLGLLTQVRLVLQARALLRRDVDYIVREGRIDLVDEFTGRVIRDRQWPDGLHEAVEIKEGLSGRSRGRILSRITLRDFLALYPGLCGMTGTAVSAASELNLFYGLGVTRIPPHVPCRRIDRPDQIYPLQSLKEEAIVGEIADRHGRGQPILVGTASVEESERLAALVRARKLPCEVLNARQDAAEAAIIAHAGRTGAITLSTNMAGRGVDIQLENPADGGLYVIGTNRHRSIRIDRQLRGRAGRQGDPGESCFFLSLQDDLIERYQIRDVLPREYQDLSAYAKPGNIEKPLQPIEDARVRSAMEHTQRVVEGQLFQQRQALARYSALVEEQRQMIYRLRLDILTGRKKLTVWQDSQDDTLAARLKALADETSEQDVRQAQQQAACLILSRNWADYLEGVDTLLNHVSLMRAGPNDPFTTFNKQIIDSYAHFLDTFEQDLLELPGRLTVHDGRFDLEASGLKNPPSTRTYLIDDGSDSLDATLGVSGMVAAAANPVFFLLVLAAKWKQRREPTV
ncbi:MAG: accessory Sec system translocase SecA2 [Clostridiaceae bacterium]|nr:accessory Sec system translocase SecA2 [Clostridiaceae bacterium]